MSALLRFSGVVVVLWFAFALTVILATVPALLVAAGYAGWSWMLN